MNPITYVIINVAVVWLIWIGAIKVDEGILTQGQVIALYSYMSQILVELIKLANLIVLVNKSIASGNRIAAIFDITSSMEYGLETLQHSASGEEIVSFHKVSLAYHASAEESLSDIDFTVYKGETIGIIGGTGSGKSSLVHMIPRFYDATKGEVLLYGKNVKNYKKEVLQDKVAVVMQKAVLFQGDIESNLRWGKQSAKKEEISLAIERAQAKDVVVNKGGLNGSITQGGKNLSGGQRQRLSIARALVKNPDILILDDSSSALDYATDASLRKAIQELPNRITVFIVSQRTSSIQHADKIVVLEDGRMVGFGTHAHLLEHSEVYREIYDSQFSTQQDMHSIPDVSGVTSYE
jgi:ABC-type multidrug transport system fused ATPase/permease subunit